MTDISGQPSPGSEGVDTERSADLRSGIVLFAATAAALLAANSPLRGRYEDLLTHHVSVGPASLHLSEPVGLWVNDALMALFFLVVGLEIKRELTVGDLRDRRTAMLPVMAALGGMVVPAALYVLLTAGTPAVGGWGIPMATDIAFALGAVALLGRRIPPGLRLLLLTAAVVDDLGAILVIALVYTDDVSRGWLLAAALTFAVVLLLRALVGWRYGPSGRGHLLFVVAGVALWYCLLRSGVHATLAGVLMGFAAPTAQRSPDRPSLARSVEVRLHPWSAYLVLPLFALANAGVPLDGIADHVVSPVATGVIVGLVIGKVTGVFGGAWIARRLRIGVLPADVTPRRLAAGALLTGIGFTVSLFVTDLAFDDPLLRTEAKIGILVASTIAGVAGGATAVFADRRRSRNG